MSDSKADADSASSERGALAARIAGLSRNQTGASLLAHLATEPGLARALIETASGGVVPPDQMTAIAEAARRARRAANRAKIVGTLWLVVSLLLLAAAITWPILEKLVLKRSESLVTGLAQACLTLLGGLAGSFYLAAKRRQSRIEDALRRLLFQHAETERRLAQLQRAVDGQSAGGRPATAPPKRAGVGLLAQGGPAATLPAHSGHPMSESEALALAAQLKEISIKRYAWGLAAGTATVAAVILFGVASLLPALVQWTPGALDNEIAGSLQPVLGVALPVLLLALRQQAMTKAAELDATVTRMMEEDEPHAVRAERGIAVLATIDRGMTTVIEQLPGLGARKKDV